MVVTIATYLITFRTILAAIPGFLLLHHVSDLCAWSLPTCATPDDEHYPRSIALLHRICHDRCAWLIALRV